MKKQKQKRVLNPWTDHEEDILIKNVEKHVLCLTRAFKQTSREIQRTPTACCAHWYAKTSIKSGRTLFFTASGRHVAVNRKNSKGEPIQRSLYQKLLAIIGLSC